VVQETILYPYLEGTGFVQRLWQSAAGRPSPLAELLPQSTEQVSVVEVSAGGRDEPTEIRLEAALGERYSNTLGAMETTVLLTELAGDDAASAALGWDGDRFVLVDAPGGSALAWWSVWDDAEARDRFVATLTPALGRLPRPARLAARELDGRPAALLEVGEPGSVTPRIVGGAR
jgi:hypothetical protein